MPLSVPQRRMPRRARRARRRAWPWGCRRGQDRHNEAGRAEAALRGVVLDEARHHRVDLVAVLERLDRGDLLALRVAGGAGAGVDGLAVDVHRAGAAVRRVADVLAPGEVQLS